MENKTLVCEKLTKRYGTKMALENVSLSLTAGRIVGLLGPNGSGKTTLLKLAAGLLTPNSGVIRVCDLIPGVESKKRTSYLPERTYLPPSMRVNDAIALFDDFYEDFDRTKAIAMLDDLKLSGRSKLSSLSKGTREKIQLILVMSRKAQLYLLDEPIGGVDPAARDYILNTIIKSYSEDATLVISTHLIGDIEKVLDDVVMIGAGKLAVQASVEQIREEQGKSVDELFREVFRCF